MALEITPKETEYVYLINNLIVFFASNFFLPSIKDNTNSNKSHTKENNKFIPAV